MPGCKIEVSLHGDVIVCVDGKVDDPLVIDEEPLVIDESGIVHHPEPHVIKSENNHGQEQDAEPCVIEQEPIPQQNPKRKCNYPQVGEQTMREEDAEEDHGNGSAVKKIVAGGLAVLMAMAMGVVGLALIGAAILFMPMLGGMNE